MGDQLETLRKLQAIDAELFRLRHDQRHKPLMLEQTKASVQQQQAAAQAIETRLRAVQMQQKEKELELSTREANIKKLQGQLFQVKTNKAYTAMQHEIDQCKADVSLLEEEIITLLDATEHTKREHEAQLGQVSQQQAALREDEARVTKELAIIQEQITALEQQRQTFLPLVKRETLSVYERVLTSREGLALVPLINDSCGGCHMVQPPQVVNEVYLNAKLVTCESCNRILYVDTSQSQAVS